MTKKLPTISLNKIAEFTVATQARKAGILKTIKSTKIEDFTKRITYSAAKSAFKTFMVDSNHDVAIFEVKKNQLLGLKPLSDFKKADVKNSLLAIKAIEKSWESLLEPYLPLKARRGFPKRTSNVVINGILVHLAPDVAFFKNTNNEITGAVKLVFSKNRAVTPMEGQIIAGLMYRYIKRKFKTDADSKNCFAFDVFAKKIYSEPTSFDYHLIRLRKTYSEIKELWPKVS